MRYLIILLLLTGCVSEDCYELGSSEDQWRTYVGEPGKFKVTPVINNEVLNEQPHSRWQVILRDGFNNYSLEPYSENHDWMKLAGSSLCRTCASDVENVMLGVRYLPTQIGDGVPDVNNGEIQISFYLNIDGVRYDRWHPEPNDDYPIVVVEQDSLIEFWYATKPNEVTMGIIYGDTSYTAIQVHPGVEDYRRTITGWMGGTTKPNTRKVFDRRLICE